MNWTEKVERLVAESGVSYRQVEQRAGWAESTLKTAMKRRASISIDKAFSLARAFDVSPDWLFDESKGWDEPHKSAADASKGHLMRGLRTLVLAFGCVNVGQREMPEYVAIMTVLQVAIERLQKMETATSDFVDRTIDGVQSVVRFLCDLQPNHGKINTAHLLRALDTGKVNIDEPEELLVNSDKASGTGSMFSEERRTPYHYNNTPIIDPHDLILLDDHKPVTVEVIQPNPVTWQGSRLAFGSRFSVEYSRVLDALQAGQVKIVAVDGVEIAERATVEVKVIIDGYLWDGKKFNVGDRIQCPYYAMVPAIQHKQVILAAIPRK